MRGRFDFFFRSKIKKCQVEREILKWPLTFAPWIFIAVNFLISRREILFRSKGSVDGLAEPKIEVVDVVIRGIDFVVVDQENDV